MQMKISPRALEWMTTAQTVRVLHRFDTVWNVADQHHRVLALQTVELPMSPFAWQLPYLPTSPTLTLKNGCLHTGTHQYDPQQATVWQPIPHANVETQNLASLRGYNTQYAAPLQQLITAIIGRDKPAIVAATSYLAGRGRGLTPEGDDLLLGVLIALWLRDQSSWATLIAETAAPLTTTLSAAFLRCAAVGEVSEPWHWLLAGDETAAALIRATGDTSGEAAWHGFTTMMQALEVCV